MKKYLLACLLFVLAGCATINFQSVNLACPYLPTWALAALVACAVVSTIGFVVSEWMSLSNKTQANGIIQYLLPIAGTLFVWVKSKLSRDPPKPST